MIGKTRHACNIIGKTVYHTASQRWKRMKRLCQLVTCLAIIGHAQPKPYTTMQNKAPHPFNGQWITISSLANLKPLDVFHRQLAPAKFKPEDQKARNQHVLFRKTFTLDTTDNATIYISADDYYKLYINGKFVNQGPAAGYPFHYFYNEINVSDYLQKGQNTIAVHTYYQGLINRVWVSGDNRHGLILDLNVNGKNVVSSDTSFKCAIHSAFEACGTAGYQTQFLEKYHAEAREVGFEKPDFDDTYWQQAVVNANADYQLFPQPSKQLAFEDIKPASIKKNGQSIQIDFGGIFVGGFRFKAKGKAGDVITMRFAQELEADGSLRYKLRANCTYIEYFVLSGKDDILNQFDYKAFRYAEIILPENSDIQIDEASIVFEARHYPFELKAKCKYDAPEIKPIWDLCVSSLQYGTQEVIMDCMEREKGYYLGDGCYSLLTFCLLTQDYALMEKFFDDFLRTKFINRGLMTCGNCSMMQEIAEYPLIMYSMLLEYCHLTKNYDFVRERYDAFVDILDFYREQYAQENGLLNNLDKWCVVEWPANLRDGYDVDIREGKVCTTMHNAVNAYYIGAIKCLNEVARLIGKPDYADTKPLQEAFIKAFYVPEKHLFKDSVSSNHISYHANVFAYLYQLQPDDPEFKTAFLNIVRTKRFTVTNMFATFPLLCTLIREGENDLFYELLTDPQSWNRIIREGGTRTFEGWGKETKWNTSLFHLTLSFGAAFLTDWDIKTIFTFK